MYLIRYAYKGSASLQLDAHQQEQAEIERLEGSAREGRACAVWYCMDCVV